MNAIDPGLAVELRAGRAVVAVRPDAGGRIGQITVDGRRLLRGYDEVEETPETREIAWALWGAYPLAPWSNRVAEARFRFDGVEHCLEPNWPDGSAIHGLVATMPWTVSETDDRRVRLTVMAEGGPFRVRCDQRLVLSEDRLDWRVAVRNDGTDTVPAGVGVHPWFRYGSLELDAAEVWPTHDLLPSGPPVAVDPPSDLRHRREPPVMDQCYTGLCGHRANLDDLDLLWSANVENVIVYTGTPGWMCVEPVTNAVNGFNLLDAGWNRHGVVALAPHVELVLEVTFRWRRAD